MGRIMPLVNKVPPKNYYIVVRLGMNIDGEDWHRERAKHLPKFIESLNRQTDQEFKVFWIDIQDVEHIYDFAIQHLMAPNQILNLSETWAEELVLHLPEDCITTRCDTDDEMMPTFVEQTKIHCYKGESQYYKRGIVTDGETAYEVTWVSNSFLSTYHPNIHCYSFPHPEMGRHIKMREIQNKEPMWVHHIHSNNTRPEEAMAWYEKRIVQRDSVKLDSPGPIVLETKRVPPLGEEDERATHSFDDGGGSNTDSQ